MHNTLSRRSLLMAGGSTLLPAMAQAAMGPTDKFDLLVRNATCWTRART